jgi:hypothetical protein
MKQGALRPFRFELDAGLGAYHFGVGLVGFGLCCRSLAANQRPRGERNFQAYAHRVGVGLGEIAALAHHAQRQLRRRTARFIGDRHPGAGAARGGGGGDERRVCIGHTRKPA